jgi:hypothetical protein
MQQAPPRPILRSSASGMEGWRDSSSEAPSSSDSDSPAFMEEDGAEVRFLTTWGSPSAGCRRAAGRARGRSAPPPRAPGALGRAARGARPAAAPARRAACASALNPATVASPLARRPARYSEAAATGARRYSTPGRPLMRSVSWSDNDGGALEDVRSIDRRKARPGFLAQSFAVIKARATPQQPRRRAVRRFWPRAAAPGANVPPSGAAAARANASPRLGAAPRGAGRPLRRAPAADAPLPRRGRHFRRRRMSFCSALGAASCARRATHARATRARTRRRRRRCSRRAKTPSSTWSACARWQPRCREPAAPRAAWARPALGSRCFRGSVPRRGCARPAPPFWRRRCCIYRAT